MRTLLRVEEDNYAKQLTQCRHFAGAAETSATVTSDTYCVPSTELGLVGMGGGRRWVGVWRDLAGPHGGAGMRAGTGGFGGNREGRHEGAWAVPTTVRAERRRGAGA